MIDTRTLTVITNETEHKAVVASIMKNFGAGVNTPQRVELERLGRLAQAYERKVKAEKEALKAKPVVNQVPLTVNMVSSSELNPKR